VVSAYTVVCGEDSFGSLEQIRAYNRGMVAFDLIAAVFEFT